MPTLVVIASEVVGTFVRWFGMTALIEGNSITLPYGRLLIADGCSGIRYFAISILLGMMTAILNDYRWKGWFVTLLAAMLIGLVANWVRIVILVIVAYETNMQSGLMTDHEVMGWAVFAAFIMPAMYFSPIRKRENTEFASTKHSGIRKTGFVAITFAAIIGPLGVALAQSPALEKPPWALQLQGYTQVHNPSLPLPIALPETIDESTWKFGNVWISLGQSQKATKDQKLVPYLPPTFDRSTWQVERQIDSNTSVYLNILSRQRVMMAQWYRVGSRSSQSYSVAKLLQIPAMLTGESRFAVITLQTNCSERDCSSKLPEMSVAIKAVSERLE